MIKMQKNRIVEQKPKEYKRVNQSYIDRNNLYKTVRWRIARRKHLDKSPLCVKCGKVADTVDHSKLHSGAPDPITGKTWVDYFWDASTYQSMCKSCHSTKTRLVDMKKDKVKRLTLAEKKELLAY